MSFTCRLPAGARHVHILATDRAAEGASGDSHPRVRNSATLPLSCTGLLFDTGDVLFDQTAWWRWVVRLLWQLGTPVQYSELCRTWKTEFLGDVSCGRREYWDAFRALMRSVGMNAGQIDELVLASQSKHRQYLETVRPLQGVSSTLAQLAAMGTPMAVLSDTSESHQCVSDHLERLGIGAYFHGVFSTCDLGLRPPDPQLYRAAATAMGLEASEIAFVGHDAEELAGAADAGMLTIAFNHDSSAHADVYLDRFAQLIQTVKTQPTRRQAG